MKLIKICIISIIIVIIGSIVFDVIENNTDKRIESMRDTSLSWYFYNKKLAVDFLDILTIVDSSSYNRVKNKLYSFMSDSMRNEYFRYDTYPNLSGEYKKPVIIINNIRGDMTGKKLGDYIYKLDVTLVYEGISSGDVTFLVRVNNGIMYKVERI